VGVWFEKALSFRTSSGRQDPALYSSLPVFWRFGNAGELTESAKALAQSKTLPRDPKGFADRQLDPTA